MAQQIVQLGLGPHAAGSDSHYDAHRKHKANVEDLDGRVIGLEAALGPVTAPAIIRGTLSGARWAGLTVGSNQSSAVRQQNLLALQEAVNAAYAQRKFFELEPGLYEIQGTAPLVIPRGTFVWRGSQGSAGYTGTSIKKFGMPGEPMGPILKMGGYGGDGCESLDFRGVAICYGSNTAGDTTANALQLGEMFMCRVEQIDITSNWNGSGWDYAPWRGIYIDDESDAVGYFSTILRNVRVRGAQQNHLCARTVGTGNVFENLYLSNGTGVNGATLPLNGSSFFWSSTAGAQYGNVVDQLNIEWTNANTLLRVDETRGMVINSLHLEGNRSTGWNPNLIYAVGGSTLTINGLDVLHHRFLLGATGVGMDASATGAIVGTFGGSRVKVTGVNIQQDVASQVDRPWVLAREADTSGDAFPTVVIENGSIMGGAAAGTYHPDLYINASDTPRIISFERYAYRDALSEMVAPVIDAYGNHTIYGQFRNAVVRYPAVMGANRTLTLSNRSKASGSLAAVPPPVGTILTVRRRTGTADAFSVTINNHDGTLLSTLSTSNTTLRFRFDGTNWALVT